MSNLSTLKCTVFKYAILLKFQLYSIWKNNTVFLLKLFYKINHYLLQHPPFRKAF